MKKVIGILLLLTFLGCSEQKVQSYLETPQTLLEDPLTTNHQKALDELERSYLHKEISYADYLQKKKQLEDDYSKAVNARKDITEPDR